MFSLAGARLRLTPAEVKSWPQSALLQLTVRRVRMHFKRLSDFETWEREGRGKLEKKDK